MSWGHVEAVYKLSRSSRGAKNLLSYLAHRANEYGQCWPSQETIVEETGISQPQIYRFVKELKDINELETERRNKGAVTVYKIKLNPIKAKKGIQNENNDDNEGIQSEKKGIQNENSNSQIDNKGIQNDNEGIHFEKKGIQFEYQTVKNNQSNNQSNNQRNGHEYNAPPSADEEFRQKAESKPKHHRYGKGELLMAFSGPNQAMQLWPMFNQLQDLCNVPSWRVFEDNLFDCLDLLESWPERSKVEQIVAGIKLTQSDGKCWPSQVIQEIRDQLKPEINVAPLPPAKNRTDADIALDFFRGAHD